MSAIGQGVQQTARAKDQNVFCYPPQHPAELSSGSPQRLPALARATSARPNGTPAHGTQVNKDQSVKATVYINIVRMTLQQSSSVTYAITSTNIKQTADSLKLYFEKEKVSKALPLVIFLFYIKSQPDVGGAV